MSKTRFIPAGLMLLVVVLLMVACTPEETPQPTVDTNMIYTAAAQTVAAQLTQNSALTPPATSTNTSEPTATQELPTLQPVGAGTAAGGLLTATPLFTIAPIAGASTATLAPVPSTGDKAEWVSNTPADGSKVEKGSKFDIKWVLRNNGTTTWNKNYSIRYYAQDKLTERNTYYFREEVKPGNTTTVIADGIAPSKTGDYSTLWVVTNEQGVNFYSITLEITVGNPDRTATPDLSDFCQESDYYDEHVDVCDEYCEDHDLVCPSD